MIPEKLLRNYHAKQKKYFAGEYIYTEGSSNIFYYQVISGSVKLNNINDKGQEFIQNIFNTNECFDEAMLFLDKSYATNAVALSDTELMCLSKKNIVALLKDFPQYAIEINKNLAHRMYYKILVSRTILYGNPEAKVLSILDYFKNTKRKTDNYTFPLTRQQMADLTGLRVETVIRTVKSLEKKGKLTIQHRKIVY